MVRAEGAIAEVLVRSGDQIDAGTYYVGVSNNANKAYEPRFGSLSSYTHQFVTLPGWLEY